MYAQGATAPFRQYGKITACLRRLDDAEGILLSGHGEVSRIITGEVQEHAAVRAAFVSLSGRMQKTRAETQASSHFFGIAHRHADHLQRLFIFGVHRNVAEDGEVISGTEARKRRFRLEEHT